MFAWTNCNFCSLFSCRFLRWLQLFLQLERTNNVIYVQRQTLLCTLLQCHDENLMDWIFLSIMILCYINQIPSNPFTSIFNVICFFYVTTLIYDIFVITHLNSTVRKSSRKLSKQRLNRYPYYTNIHHCLFYCVCTGITIISGGAKLFYVLKPRPLVKWCGFPSVCFLHVSKMLTLA